MDDKIKRYARIKYSLAIIEVVYLLFLLLLLQVSGFAIWLRAEFARLFANEVLLILFYCLGVFLLYLLLNFPLEFYRSYLLEHRFGLSTERFLAWLSDFLKANLIGFIIFAILIEVFFFFLRHYPDNWWWMSSLFWIFLSLILARLFPVLILPLFFKYKGIDNEDLRQRILDLANKMKIKILDVYQIDFSRKSRKANAGLVGLGKSKRVLLTDTLQDKYAPEEIEVILAHEFAHFQLRHLIKLLVLNASVVLFVFYFLFKFSHLIFTWFHLNLTDIASLGLWIFCFVLFQVFFTPLLNWISRNMERNADQQAIKFSGQKQAFVSMMEKLSQQNLIERKPAGWVKIFFFDHPTVEERIALVKDFRDASLAERRSVP